MECRDPAAPAIRKGGTILLRRRGVARKGRKAGKGDLSDSEEEGCEETKDLNGRNGGEVRRPEAHIEEDKDPTTTGLRKSSRGTKPTFRSKRSVDDESAFR